MTRLTDVIVDPHHHPHSVVTTSGSLLFVLSVPERSQKRNTTVTEERVRRRESEVASYFLFRGMKKQNKSIKGDDKEHTVLHRKIS